MYSSLYLRRFCVCIYMLYTLRKKCPNTELFLVRVFPYSDWIRNSDQSECGKIRTRNNSAFGHFSRSYIVSLFENWSAQLRSYEDLEESEIYIWYSYWAKVLRFHIESWPEWDSNPRPSGYRAHALTTELSGRTMSCA